MKRQSFASLRRRSEWRRWRHEILERINGRGTGNNPDRRIHYRGICALRDNGMSDYRSMSKTKCCRECGEPLPEGSHFRRLYCDRCKRLHRLETYRKSQHRSYKKHRKARLLEKKDLYEWYKLKGICVDCHQRDALIEGGKHYTRCAECLEKNRKKKKA